MQFYYEYNYLIMSHLDCDAVITTCMPLMPNYEKTTNGEKERAFIRQLNASAVSTGFAFAQVVLGDETCMTCRWKECNLTRCICDDLIELGVCIQCMSLSCICAKKQEYSDHCLCHLESDDGCDSYCSNA